MNTIEQPQAPGHGPHKFTSRPGACADTADAVLLLVTILTLMGVAAAIAIGYPLALEVVATHANAAIAVSPAPQARIRIEPEEEIEKYDEPLIVDDVRSEERMYAAVETTGSIDRSAPAASGNNVP